MKNYVKTAIDTLHALGFQLDHDDRKVRTDRWIYTHANAPGDRLILNYRMSETAARAVTHRARVIVGLATSDGKEKRQPKANHRAKMERAVLRRRQEAASRAADARRAKANAERDAAVVERRRRELDSLMRGKPGQVGATGMPREAMLTVAQVADWTGATDKAVERAIESGALEAYQCGKEVRVKGRDVRAWLNPSEVAS